MSTYTRDEPRSKGGFNLGDYVEVKDRIRLFLERYPDGRLVTTDVRATKEPDDTPRIWVEAAAYRSPEDPLPGRGWSWMELPGKTTYTKGSELENTETSAWGRAIGALGIGIDKSIASKNEIDAKAGESPGREDGGLIGTAEVGKGQADFELRQTPDGHALAFRLVEGRRGIKVIALDELAVALHTLKDDVVGKRVTAWGRVATESFKKGAQTIEYQVLHLERIQTPEWTLPAAIDEPPPEQVEAQRAELDAELATLPW